MWAHSVCTSPHQVVLVTQAHLHASKQRSCNCRSQRHFGPPLHMQSLRKTGNCGKNPPGIKAPPGIGSLGLLDMQGTGELS